MRVTVRLKDSNEGINTLHSICQNLTYMGRWMSFQLKKQQKVIKYKNKTSTKGKYNLGEHI